MPHYWLLDTEDQTLSVLRWTERGYVEVQRGRRGERIQAEPFDAFALPIGALFGDDEE